MNLLHNNYHENIICIYLPHLTVQRSYRPTGLPLHDRSRFMNRVVVVAAAAAAAAAIVVVVVVVHKLP